MDGTQTEGDRKMYVMGYDHSRKFTNQSVRVQCHQLSRYCVGQALRAALKGNEARSKAFWDEAKDMAKKAKGAK